MNTHNHKTGEKSDKAQGGKDQKNQPHNSSSHNPHTENHAPPNNVIPMKPQHCVTEGCTLKPERANFCREHYSWFKEGLITLEGFKAKDFDKKYQEYLRRKEAS